MMEYTLYKILFYVALAALGLYGAGIFTGWLIWRKS